MEGIADGRVHGLQLLTHPSCAILGASCNLREVLTCAVRNWTRAELEELADFLQSDRGKYSVTATPVVRAQKQSEIRKYTEI